jgi:hypothetical protein
MAIDLPRETLYERVWTTPVTTLAQEFGMSDAGVAKVCRKMGVPVPSRGYWAKIQAGKNPPKTPLPNIGGNRTISPEEIVEQQKEKRLELPGGNSALHPMVRKFGTALRAAVPGYQKLHQVGSYHEGISVSEPRISRAIRSLDAIAVRLETRGVEFRPSSWVMRSARPTFRKGHISVGLGIRESLETVKSAFPLPYDQRERPSGRLEFSVVTGCGNEGRETFVERSDAKLEELLHGVAERIWRYFCEREEQARQWAKEHACWLVTERARREAKQKQDHEDALAKIKATRSKNIRLAGSLWRIHRDALEFIDECEKRWRALSDSLSPEQIQWLAWARAEVRGISPFEAGYPSPADDGAFDAAQIPLGGPYPFARVLSDPK